MNQYFDQIKPNSTIILAFSSGPDSVYLLHQLLKLSSKHQIILAHVNHQTRGQENMKDQKFAEKIAAKHNLRIEIATKPISSSGNFEDKARQFRYKFFENTRQKFNADWILTAHHLNDQFETFLFNLVRGASLEGFKGIAAANNKKHLLRPLLQTTKAEILDYLKKHQLKFRNDKSNHDLKYSRNYMRHKIVPLFERINSKYIHNFCNALDNLSANLNLVTQLTEKWIKQNVRRRVFNLDKFLSQPAIMQEHILQKLCPNALTKKQLQEILKTLQQKKSNRKKEFGHNSILKIVKNNQNGQREVEIVLVIN